MVVLSVGLASLKWMPATAEADAESHSQTAGMIDTFLQQNGFSVSRRATDYIEAGRGGCSVIIKAVAPQGWNESQMQVISTGRRLYYVVDGNLYPDDQPVWRTWFEDTLQRTLFRIGIETRKKYVFGIAPSLSCDALQVDWTTLAKQPI